MGTQRAQYDVGGMSCSFCADSIRKAYERTEGVEDASVSLAHEEVRVEYDDEVLSEVQVKDALRDLGYTIRDPDKKKQFEEQREELRQGKHRLALSGLASVITTVLMLFMIFGRGTFESRSTLMDLVVLGLALGTMLGPGRYILDKAYHSLRRGIFNQHVLLEAGAFAGLLGGALGLFVFPEFPTVHFFAVSVFITTYHVLSEYTSLVVRTPRTRRRSNRRGGGDRPRSRRPSSHQTRRERPGGRRSRRRRERGRRERRHGRVHPVFAMIAMVLSVSAVLLNSFGGQLLRGERPTADFGAAAGEEGPA